MSLNSSTRPAIPRPERCVVCHLTTVHRAFDTRIFHKECKTLAQAGYQVHLLACHDKDETVDGVQVHALARPANRARRILGLPLVVLRKAMAIRADIYHFHDPELIPVAAVLRLLTGARVIFDHHEDTAGQILTKYWIPKPLRWIMSGVFRSVEVVGLLGMGVIESDMIEGRYRQPFQSVRNLPMLEAHEPTPRTRADFQGPPVLVYVGGVTEIRGAWHMLEVAKILRDRGVDFTMKIIGPIDPPELAESMEAFVAEHGLTQTVEIHGPAPFPEAMEIIRTGTAGLCLLDPVPNYLYALSTKVLEYMQYGLPAVATDLPCTGGYVRQCGGGIVVDPSRPDEVADQLTALLADPDRMLEYSHTGQKSILSEVNWDHEAQLLLAFYRRMLGADIPPGPCYPHHRRVQPRA